MAAIARDRHYELECLQVILVPRHTSPAETQVKTAKSRRLLRQAEILARTWQIPIHTQIRVAHDPAQAILEIIKERHIDLILMGWKGNTITPGRIFGSVVDTVIRQATCDVVLLKLGEEKDKIKKDRRILYFPTPTPQFNRWLVPMAGGPNSQVVIQLLPALVTLGDAPSIQLCQVFQPSETADITVLSQAMRYLLRRRNFSGSVTTAPVHASSVSEGVINLVKKNHFDVVVLGASREGLLQQAIKGNIPAAIASRVESTVILVRGAIGK